MFSDVQEQGDTVTLGLIVNDWHHSVVMLFWIPDTLLVLPWHFCHCNGEIASIESPYRSQFWSKYCVVTLGLSRCVPGIREHQNVKGIKSGSLETRVTLYADDLFTLFSWPGGLHPHFTRIYEFLREYLQLYHKLVEYQIHAHNRTIYWWPPDKVAFQNFTYLALQLTD